MHNFHVGASPSRPSPRTADSQFEKRSQLFIGTHHETIACSLIGCAAAFQRWRILPFDRTLNGIHTLLQNPRFLILDTASLSATNVAIHPHRQRSAAIAHAAIHAQYDSRAFAPVRRGIGTENSPLKQPALLDLSILNFGIMRRGCTDEGW